MIAPAAYRTRPPRFPIRAPIYYRGRWEPDWTEGTTLNISRGGVLFQSPTELEPQCVVQVRILFPAELTGAAAANMVGTATILRMEPERSAVAASLVNCRFVQGE